jgi:hypothetical protein
MPENKGGRGLTPKCGIAEKLGLILIFWKHTLNDTRQQEFIKERLLYFRTFYELFKKLVIWDGVVAR